MYVTINVEPKHIKGAKRNNGYCCPVARAAKSFIRKGIYLGIDRTKCFFSKKKLDAGLVPDKESVLHEIAFSDKVQEIICNYDFNGKMEPFQFKLNIPKEYLAEAKG